MNDVELRATLAKMVKQLECIDAKISQMPQVQIQVSGRLLPTLLALQKIEAGSATQVSMVTKRCRAFESKNLNELSMMGVASKQTRGHERIFRLKEPRVVLADDVLRQLL
jgi:pyrimidine operon attenuation protein/uracil phosphoribosyltransferase